MVATPPKADTTDSEADAKPAKAAPASSSAAAAKAKSDPNPKKSLKKKTENAINKEVILEQTAGWPADQKNCVAKLAESMFFPPIPYMPF